MVIIPRRIDVRRVERGMPWVMIYGRRKTGKTFLVEHFISYDRHYFVGRDGVVLDKKTGELYGYKEFSRILREVIGEKTVVIDEFHRLPEQFLDFLHSLGVRGSLILITSTLWLAKKLMGAGQPLLGLVRPVKIGLADEREVLAELSKSLRGRQLVESSVYLREVMLAPFYKGGGIREFLAGFLLDEALAIKEIIGEIFAEEDRELSGIYDGILKAVASGKNVSTEISSYLYSRRLIPKDNPGSVQKYLGVMTEMGLLDKVKVYEKRKFRYYHASPLFDLHYYLESKYFYSEIEVPEAFVEKVVDEKIPVHVEQFYRALMSKIYGLPYQLVEERNLEVDIALTSFRKVRVVGEVKWRRSLSGRELRSIGDKLGRFKEAKKILVVPSLDVLEREPEGIEVWDPEITLEKARESLEDELAAKR